MSVFFLGIAGGTASGKTHLTRQLCARLSPHVVNVVPVDSYYRELTGMSATERAAVNFDHPEAFDFELLLNHLSDLRAGIRVDIPNYNYVTHSRDPSATSIAPVPLVIVEGIMTLYDARVRDHLDFSVFVDANEELCFKRRLERDMRERGRTEESVRTQWQATVIEGHRKYCAPTREHADLILDGGALSNEAIADLMFRVQSMVGRSLQK